MESIISRIGEKINIAFLLGYFWAFLGFFLVISAFFLGRITKFMENSPAFSFEVSSTVYKEEKDSLFGNVSTSTIVASSGGKKYYFVWCKGAGNIKQSKKRYFESEVAAQKAGYTLAANCK